MESVPLTLAHTHARNAMLETRKSNPVAASEEHDLAAGEFASASQHCMDAYALRTLRLLEDEHKRLAILLRSQHENPTGVLPSDVPAVAAPSGQPLMRVGDEASTSSRANHIRTSISAATNDLLQQPPRLPGNNRHLQRDKSSIASNLASARGIPAYPRRASPVSPTLSAQPAGAQLSDSPSRARTGEARHRERAGKYPTQSKLSGQYPGPSPTDLVSQQMVPPESRDPEYDRGRFAATDETFQKFYSSFEGLISKLSAPLAFAGLPLNTQSPDSLRQKSPADTKVDRHNATSQRRSTNAEPDINSIFSRAALRAVREANGEMPSTGAESFYVVPTSGGTVSYAGILSRAEKEARRSSLDDGDEDFVDARETPSSPELRQSLSGSHRLMRDTSERNTKTMEELRMENETLKQLTDQLSKRLHMWEVNAQSSSLALQQSLKAMHHQQTTTSSPTASSAIAPPTLRSVQPASDMLPAVENHEKRIKELEEIIQHSEKERDKAVRENEKLKSVLSRYRDRWEKLKEGAKTRRNATETSAAAGLSSVDSPITTPDVRQGEDDEQSLFAEEQTRSEANESSD